MRPVLYPILGRRMLDVGEEIALADLMACLARQQVAENCAEAGLVARMVRRRHFG